MDDEHITSQPIPEEFWTVQELSKYIKVSQQTIRAWIRAGKVKAVPMGHSYRIPVAEVHRVAREGVDESS